MKTGGMKTMNLEITSREKNPLLSREEIVFEVKDSKITPSRKELRQKIAALTNAKEETVIVDRLEQRFGSKEIKGKAKIYESKEKLEKIELEFLVNRNMGKKGKEEKPAKEAKPESKEETKEEKKKAV